MENDFVFYLFSRSKVERIDFSHFLNQYALDKLPTGKRLQGMMNSLAFGIEGWDNDQREIHSIPGVRRFYTAFHDAWPYWLYFCNLDTDNLRSMVIACMQNITEIKVDGYSKVGIQCDFLELVRFIGDDFMSMNLICERAGMSEVQIYQRSKAEFEYFGLPFNAEPPH